MIFHETCLLADNSREISYILFRKLRKMLHILSSAAFVIGALRVNEIWHYFDPQGKWHLNAKLSRIPFDSNA